MAFSAPQDLTRYTVDVTTALAFGEDPNTLERDGNVIQRHLDKIFPAVFKRVLAPLPAAVRVAPKWR